MKDIQKIEDLFKPAISNKDKADWLAERHQKGETKEELLSAIHYLRKNMRSLDLNGKAMDLCGTGGSGKQRFNTSTAVAFVIAAMGVPVVKHGNRGSKKANGSFDFLEALGIEFNLNGSQVQQQFEAFKCCFCFAKNHHPIMKEVAEARKMLPHPTLFNLVGPFCNPADVKIHLLGCSNLDKAKLFAELAMALNYQKMCIVVGAEGLDEASPAGMNHYLTVSGQNTATFTLDPATYGLDSHLPDIEDASESAQRFLHLIENFSPQDPIFKLICLNAGLALYTYGKTVSLVSAFGAVKVAFEAGLVADYFQHFKAHNQSLSHA